MHTLIHSLYTDDLQISTPKNVLVAVGGLTLTCRARAHSHPNAIFHSFQVQELETQDMETIHCENKQSHIGTVE